MNPARRVPLWWVGLAVVALMGAVAVLIARGGSDVATHQGIGNWNNITQAARGQTVRLWMWGGEEALNRYVDDDVTNALAAVGVTVQRVPIDDTATAITRIVAEREAGRTGDGSVDLLWVNGKNFAQGAASGLWLTNWAQSVPNARYFDPDDSTLHVDFEVETNGSELAWSRAAFVFAYDSAKMVSPPSSFDELMVYATAHPGRLTYPSPPDFTGSAFVRQAVQAMGQEGAFEYLARLRPLMWKAGNQQPKDQPELERLFADGELDLAMSYNPGFVESAVRRGVFADTIRPFVFTAGTLQNVSFLAIPANAAHRDGAMVVANLMAGPALQAAKWRDVGLPTVLELDRLGSERALFDTDATGLRLVEFGTPLAELSADRVVALDRRWLQELAP
jgi:putative spermidine/putrescine transport system substrate-binding protein